MCGILGKIGSISDQDRLKLSQAAIYISHRGPDENGTLENQNFWFTSTRLRVVGEDVGRQPMALHPHQILLYNGEITNFKTLNSQRLHSDPGLRSDTSFLYNVLSKSKFEILEEIEGHFAFAFWNQNSSELYLGRDRNGEKPLFYLVDRNGIAFSSSLDALRVSSSKTSDISPASLASYLRWGYVDTEDETFFRGIRQVPAGKILMWKRDGGISLCKEIITSHTNNEHGIDKLQEAIPKFEAGMSDVVTRFLDADVEIGVLLSGGLDSSLIASFAAEQKRNLKTFSILIPTSKDDYSKANLISKSLNTKHSTTEFLSSDFEKYLQIYMSRFDLPIADTAIFPLMKLIDFSKNHLNVAMAGEGADELFAGYPWAYAKLLRSSGIMASRFADLAFRLGRMAISNSMPQSYFSNRILSNNMNRLNSVQRKEHFARPNEYFSSYEIELLGITPDVFHEEVNAFELKDALTFDQKHYLKNNLLLKSDRSSMAFGFELRLPYLAPSIISLASRLSPNLLLNFSDSKILLREVARKRMPLLNWKSKKTGMGIPTDWIRENIDFVPHLKKMLSSRKLSTMDGMIDGRQITAISQNSLRKSWNLYMLLNWLESRL